MRRILYVTDSLMSGGIEAQLTDLVTRLDRERFAPHILCLYGPRVRSLRFAPQIHAAGIPLTTLDLGWSARDKARAVARIVAATWAIRPRIVQAEGYHANLLTRLARPFLPPVRLVGTVRGVETAKQLLYERLSHRLCAALVASGPHLKLALHERAGIGEQRVRVIPNAVDTSRFVAPHDPDLRRRIAPDAGRVLVSVGRISREKSMHLIAQALGLLARQGRLPPDGRVFIVGEVEHSALEMQTLLDEAIARDGLGAHVIQYPATAHPEDFYHASDASILASPREGISIAMLESLAAGRPVVISAGANAAGVIEHGVTGWIVRTNDMAHLAETLHTALTMPAAALEAMRVACRERAAEYAVEALVERYARLYDDLLREGRRADQ
jgi:glycosyltransferase involved in cell wall biosynthesis